MHASGAYSITEIFYTLGFRNIWIINSIPTLHLQISLFYCNLILKNLNITVVAGYRDCTHLNHILAIAV